MDVCVRLFRVQVAALRQFDPPSKESYRLRIDLETEKAAKVHKGCRAIDRQISVSNFTSLEPIAYYLQPPHRKLKKIFARLSYCYFILYKKIASWISYIILRHYNGGLESRLSHKSGHRPCYFYWLSSASGFPLMAQHSCQVLWKSVTWFETWNWDTHAHIDRTWSYKPSFFPYYTLPS
jgi:hypothetical protein